VDTQKTMTSTTATEKKPTEYVNNKLLLEEFLKSREKGEMTRKLAEMLMLICERYARKGKYSSYTYNEDMQAFAIMNLVKSWKSFNPDKSSNPFAYFTSCITNSYLQYLNHERKHRNIRDALLVENGLDPSYTFTENYNTENPHLSAVAVDEIAEIIPVEDAEIQTEQPTT
jgi:DNA-directed RNA polymerase specialized sigma subunit